MTWEKRMEGWTWMGNIFSNDSSNHQHSLLQRALFSETMLSCWQYLAFQIWLPFTIPHGYNYMKIIITHPYCFLLLNYLCAFGTYDVMSHRVSWSHQVKSPKMGMRGLQINVRTVFYASENLQPLTKDFECKPCIKVYKMYSVSLTDYISLKWLLS